MPYKEDQPRLMGCLSWIPLKQVVQTQLFGKRYLTQFNFYFALSFQYESGALLGRAKSDKLIVLEKMLGNPAVEGELLQLCKDKAKERLDGFKADTGKEPDNFYEFIFEREFEKATGLRHPQCFIEAYTSRNWNMLKPFLKKIPLEEAEPYFHILGMEGVGFGSSLPEMTKIMCKNVYEYKYDMDKWSRARECGLHSSEKPEEVTFKERGESILAVVAVYARDFYPELLDALELRGYIDTEGSH